MSLKRNYAQSPVVLAASTLELRRALVVDGLFPARGANFQWWETDRAVMAGICPSRTGVELDTPADLGTSYLFEQREGGFINLGGPGRIFVDGAAYALNYLDALYVGRGAQQVVLSSDSDHERARFYLTSYPAHCTFPTCFISSADAVPEVVGSKESANEQTQLKYIHPGAFPTCQLVMGVTHVKSGCVWNTIPPHTHLRRSEIYLYFNLPPEQTVFHFLGLPEETRHVVVRDCEAVLSPPWSLHFGVGTASHSFVWSTGGENQATADVALAALAGLR